MSSHLRMDAFQRQQTEALARQARLASAAVSRDRQPAAPPPEVMIVAPTVAPIEPPQNSAPRKREWIIVETTCDERPPEYLRVRTIIEAVATHYQMTVIELVSHRRAKKIVRPRQVVMYLARQLSTRSLPEIGRIMGGRDHTTILHGIRKITAQIQDDAVLAADVEALRLKLIGGNDDHA